MRREGLHRTNRANCANCANRANRANPIRGTETPDRRRPKRYEIAADVVRAAEPIDDAAIRGRVVALVDVSAVPAILAMALNELHNLHEGNAARFRLRGSEFARWLAALTADRKRRRTDG